VGRRTKSLRSPGLEQGGQPMAHEYAPNLAHIG